MQEKFFRVQVVGAIIGGIELVGLAVVVVVLASSEVKKYWSGENHFLLFIRVCMTVTPSYSSLLVFLILSFHESHFNVSTFQNPSSTHPFHPLSSSLPPHITVSSLLLSPPSSPPPSKSGNRVTLPVMQSETCPFLLRKGA